MKFICSKDNLMEGINIVQKAVSSKATLPILEGILINCTDVCKLTGNDLEIGIECIVDADIQKRGSIILNSKMFGDIVRRLPSSEILIEVKENNLVTLECENSYFEIKGLPSEGFPEIPDIVQKDNYFESTQKTIREMIRQTIFAVGIDEYRPILTGTLIQCTNGTLTFVSLDGIRMAIRKSTLENCNAEIKVVVPGKTLNEIVKILQPNDEKVIIYTSSNQIMFDLGKCKIVSRLLEGEYINYQSIIKNEFETKCLINTKELLSSLERASLLTLGEKKYPVIFNISDEKLVLTSNTDMGAVREELRINNEGNRLKIGFNPAYFIEALRAIEDETIVIQFATTLGPCTITPVQDEKFIYVITAVRT